MKPSPDPILPDQNNSLLQASLHFLTTPYGPCTAIGTCQVDQYTTRPDWNITLFICENNDQNDAIYTDNEFCKRVDGLFTAMIPGDILQRSSAPYSEAPTLPPQPHHSALTQLQAIYHLLPGSPIYAQLLDPEPTFLLLLYTIHVQLSDDDKNLGHEEHVFNISQETAQLLNLPLRQARAIDTLIPTNHPNARSLAQGVALSSVERLGQALYGPDHNLSIRWLP